MLEGGNEMRFADMAGMFRAARHNATQWDRDLAGVEDAGKVGLKGSPTVVAQVFAPKPRAVKAHSISGDTPRAMADALLDRMFSDHPALEEYLLDHLETAGGVR